VAFWEGQKELPHIFQGAHAESFPEFFCEAFRERSDEFVAVIGAGFSLLLLLDDALADVPIGLHHSRIDSGFHRVARRLNDGANVVVECRRCK
jgi:hypothetical protein